MSGCVGGCMGEWVGAHEAVVVWGRKGTGMCPYYVHIHVHVRAKAKERKEKFDSTNEVIHFESSEWQNDICLAVS